MRYPKEAVLFRLTVRGANHPLPEGEIVEFVEPAFIERAIRCRRAFSATTHYKTGHYDTCVGVQQLEPLTQGARALLANLPKAVFRDDPDSITVEVQ